MDEELGTSSDSPLISIVIPAYNAARCLGATLDSVLAQTVTAWECIVVDDGSTDETHLVAEAYAARDTRIRVNSQRNAGPAAARNRGFRETTPSTRFITFMDGDDVWIPSALEILLGAIGDSTEVIGAHGLGEYIDEGGSPVNPGAFREFGRERLAPKAGRMTPLASDEPTGFASLVVHNVTFPPGLVLARRSAYERAGLFDERFKGPEDWDMLLRLSRHGNLRFVDTVILWYRRHSSNFGAGTQTAGMAFRVLCKNFHSPENSPEQCAIARKAYRALQLWTAKKRLTQAAAHLKQGRLACAVANGIRVGADALRWTRGCPPRI